MFRHIGPHLRTIEQRGCYTNIIPELLRSCPNLENLILNYISGPCEYDLSKIKLLQFNGCHKGEEDKTIESYFQSCSDTLESVNIIGLSSKTMRLLPISIRSLGITVVGSSRNLIAEKNYLMRNPNIKCFYLYSEYFVKNLAKMLKNLRQVEHLRLRCTFHDPNINYEELTKMPNLVELHIYLHGLNFYTYTSAVDDTQSLSELHIVITMADITPQFANSFENFRHLTCLIIHFKKFVSNPQLLMRPIAMLADKAELKKVVLSGNTDFMRLENNINQLKSVEDLHICFKGRRFCDCGNYRRYSHIQEPFDLWKNILNIVLYNTNKLKC